MNPHELHLVMTGQTRAWDPELAEAADWREWQDAPVPAGYDTVYGFMSRWEPRTLGWLAEPLEALAEDVERLAAEAGEAGIAPLAVAAPTALLRFGVETTLAFPVGQLMAEAGVDKSHVEWASKVVSHYAQPMDGKPAAAGGLVAAE